MKTQTMKEHIMKILFLLTAYTLLYVAGQSPQHVFGILNTSKNLTTHFDPLNVKDISWIHEINKKRTRILKFKNFLVDRIDNRYTQFNNGTILVIKNLTKGDNGLYTADVTLLNNEMKEEKYFLKVFDPVQPPNITVESNEDPCNFTLHCHVFLNTSDYSYIWKYRHLESDYQQYSNESSIEVKLAENHGETEFVCNVSNLADTKNTSVHLGNCSGKKHINEIHGVIVIGVIIIGVIIIGDIIIGVLLVVVHRKFQKKSSQPTGEGKQDNVLEENVPGEHVDEEHLPIPVEETHEVAERVGTHSAEEHENHDVHLNESNNTPIVDRDSGEGQAEKTDLKDHEDRDESSNKKNLKTPIQETGEQLQAHGKNEDNEFVNEEHLKTPVEESLYYKVWQEDQDEDELKKRDKDDYLDEETNIRNLLSDIIHQDEHPRIEVEEQEKGHHDI